MFTVLISSRARKELADAPEALPVLKELTIEPVPARTRDVKKMKGRIDTYRIRIGRLRIIYAVDWEQKVIDVQRIGNRESVYD